MRCRPPQNGTVRMVSLLLQMGACVCIFAGPSVGREGMSREDQRPNFVVIVADDLGYRDLSCYGCLDFQTPHIDQLAAHGIRCTAGYVSHPYCSPSRAGILSGRYQQTFGHEHNPPYREDDLEIGIDAETDLLPDLLRAAGYQTGLIGKWHLGAGPPFRPTRRGFDEFYGFLGGGHDYFRFVPGGKNYDSPLWRDGAPTDDPVTYLTDDLTAEAEAFLERHSHHPFCLMVMYNAPHSPDQVTDDYLARVADIPHPGRRRYAGLVQGVDEGVGRIVARLASLHLTERTLVIFLSDNGGRRDVSDNRPLRGNKGWLHEGGIRVPFLFSWPGTLPRGTVVDQPISALDLLPTALAAAGVPAPEKCDGVDLSPLFRGDSHTPPHETMFWRVAGGAGFAVRAGDWKLVHDIGMDHPALYRLSSDPGEDLDLSQEYPERAAELSGRYRTWAATLESPRWRDGHVGNTRGEREAAARAGTRQYPMSWVEPDRE